MNATTKVMCIFGLFLIFSLLNSSMLQNHGNAQMDALVYPPGSKPYGFSFEDWSAKWWQWKFSTEKNSPVKDLTGEKCNSGQSGPVWILAGTAGGVAERKCDIPQGKGILFPILNGNCDVITNPTFKTPEDLKKCAWAWKHVSIEASLDGQEIPDLDKYFVYSPLYNFTTAENNDLSLPPGTHDQAVSAGYYIMLKPLPAGEHDLHFRGANTDFTVSNGVNFFTEVTYHLTIK
jgi:hypothetical protein